MPYGDEQSSLVDPLDLVRGTVLLLRTLEQKARAERGDEVLTLTDIGALAQISRGVDQPSQIARMMRLDPARVTHVTDRLVGKGCVTRALDAADRRRWRLALTDEGRERLEENRGRVRASIESLLQPLTEVERTALYTGIEAVRKVLTEE